MQLILLYVMILTLGSAKRHHKLEITPEKHLIVLYLGHNNHETIKTNFKIDFDSTEIRVNRQHEGMKMFLDQKGKTEVIVSMSTGVIHSDINKLADEDNNEEIHGIIGFKSGGEFFTALQKTLKVPHVKIWFKMYENEIELIPEQCHQRIFPPYEIEMETSSKTEFISISKISLNFSPVSDRFLSLIDKKANPFVLTPEELRERINLQLLNEVQTIPLRTLINHKCNKISNSENYECDIVGEEANKHDDFGRFLFEFDPVLCTDQPSLELRQEGKIDNEGYYWSHVGLIAFQLAIIVIFKYRLQIENQISCFVVRRKMGRMH